MATITQIYTARQILGPGGITREIRESQILMAEQIAEAFTHRTHAIVEAGTGTGKSLGYATPAVLSGKQTVIATGTIALQEQLVQKDLPWLAQQLAGKGVDFTFGLAKGRQNYISMRRLQVAMTKARQIKIDGSTEDGAAALAKLAAYVDQGIGDRGLMGDVPPPEVWRRVESTSDDCLGKKCPSFAMCFYQRAKLALNAVDVVVANHALVAIDLSMESPFTQRPGGVLIPPYSNLIIDEAHHFRDNVFKAFTGTIRTGQSKRLIDAIDDELGGFADQRVAHALVRAEDGITGPLARRIGNGGTIAVSQLPVDDLLAYQAALGRVRNALPSEPMFERLDLRAARMQDTVGAMLEDGGRVVWADSTARGIELNAGPVDVAPILQDRLYTQATVVYTSATLSSGSRDFSYAKKALGLDDRPVIEGQFDSPFDYPSQCLLYSPGHLPEPTGGAMPSDDNLREVWRLVRGTHGRAFLLFSSRAAMNHAWEKLAGHMESRGFPPARQGDRPNRDLIEWFKATPGAVLFALASFWEGVSVEGSALSLVVIDRIPFPVPTDPIHQAREAKLKADGTDPFRHLALPHAVLRLKQGVGRLIRTMDDRGIVAIMDPRLQTKGYGKSIRRALPPMSVTRNFPTDQQFALFTSHPHESA
jgi:ATP-dependent DNA helicase DinG